MSTETRIGIVAGLLIVVIASVYFFYGSSHRDDDVLIAATPKPAALKIPISNEKPQSAVKPAPLVQSAPRTPAIRPQQVVAYSPPRPAVSISPAPAAPRLESLGTVGPPAERISSATGIDKYKWNGPLAPAGEASVAAAPANPPAPTLLRTSPSPMLVKATKGNLDAEPKPASPIPHAETPLRVTPEKKPLVIPETGRVKLEPEPITPTGGRSLDDPGDWPRKHVVAKGDTLVGLARQYYEDGKKSSDIVAANPGLKGRRKLKPGETILIPKPAEIASHAAKAVEPQHDGLTAVASDKTYTVEEGDTIYAIAKKTLGTSSRWKEVFELNKDQLKGDPRRLKPGMTLKLPA